MMVRVGIANTVKKFDEVVRHLHLVTQDHSHWCWKKFSASLKRILLKISNFFDRLLKMSNFFDRVGKFQKQHDRVRARTCILSVDNLPLYHCATLSYI
jgi:hypothetical protein